MDDIKGAYEQPQERGTSMQEQRFFLTDCLLTDSSSATPRVPAQNGQTANDRQVKVGQIESISIPKKWSESPSEEEAVPLGSYLELDRDGNSAISLCFYNRGLKLQDTDAARFHASLFAPPHSLSGKELNDLRAVLRDRNQPGFTFLSARTMDVQGRRVLAVEGTYNNINERTKALLVDADGSGHTVQEICYQAPNASYAKFLPEAEKAFGSISWVK